MNTKAYREWLHDMGRLTRSQRKAVLNQLNAVESQETIIDELEQNHVHHCPHCQSEQLGRESQRCGPSGRHCASRLESIGRDSYAGWGLPYPKRQCR